MATTNGQFSANGGGGEVNAYLEHRRSRLIANNALLRSLGLIPTSAQQAVNGEASQVSVTTESVSSNGENTRDSFEQQQLHEHVMETSPSRDRKKARKTGVVTETQNEASLRRSTRRIAPREKKFMEENFSSGRPKRKRDSQQRNASVKIAQFPYTPPDQSLSSNVDREKGKTDQDVEGEPEEQHEENADKPVLEFEKSSHVAVVWEAYEPSHYWKQRIVESDDEDEEENGMATLAVVVDDSEGEMDDDDGENEEDASRGRVINSTGSEVGSDSAESARIRRKQMRLLVPRPPKRYFLDLPHEKDFHATLINSASKENQHLYSMTDALSTAIPAHSINAKTCTGVLKLQIPDWLPFGEYRLQIGSARRRILCTSEPFKISEAVGQYDETNVGVWCVCGNTDARQDYTGDWVSCTSCAAWQHWSCYMRVSESRKIKLSNDNNMGHADEAPVESVLERVIVNDEETDEAEVLTVAVLDGDKSAVAATALTPEQLQQKRRKLSRRERQEVTEALAARVSHVHLLVPDVLPTPQEDFLCWACQPLTCLNVTDAEVDEEEHKSHLEALGERCELMITMIAAASGGYFRKVLAGGEDSAQTVMCATPTHVVKFLRTLIDPNREKVCVDLGAGTGSFSGALPGGSLCVEILEKRFLKGKSNRPDLNWLNLDALTPDFYRGRFGTFDLVISNPDFEVGLQFLFLGLCLVRNACLSDRGQSASPDDSKSGRLIFLLPSDYFEASNLRARIFKLLDFHIETEYKLGHLCYYEDQPQSQKLTCDSLFVLRPGRAGPRKYEHKVVNARLAGML